MGLGLGQWGRRWDEKQEGGQGADFLGLLLGRHFLELSGRKSLLGLCEY